MESPAYWSESDRIIDRVIEEAHEADLQGYCGFSLARKISDALERAGILTPQVRIEHNHFTRDIRPETCEACANTITGKQILASKKQKETK